MILIIGFYLGFVFGILECLASESTPCMGEALPIRACNFIAAFWDFFLI